MLNFGIAGLALLACAGLGVGGVRTLAADTAFNAAQKIIASGQGSGLDQIAAARAWRPDWADPLESLAQQTSFADPHAALAEAQRAAQLDPDDWESWHTLGMIEFQLDQPDAAWWAFQHGLRLNQGFEAHFEAANLAAVLGKTDTFWRELKRATAMAPLDSRLNSALDLALAFSHGSAAQVASTLPYSDVIRTALGVEYLLSRGDPSAAEAGWDQVHSCPIYNQPACATAATAVADALLRSALKEPAAGSPVAGSTGADNTAAAVRIWNRAVQQGWLRQDAAIWGHNADPNFHQTWLEQAFSWAADGSVLHQVLAMPGVTAGNEVVWQLDGTEPEQAPLFHQLVALQPNQHFAVVCRAERQGNGNQQGVVIAVVGRGGKLLLQTAVTLSPTWTWTHAQFRTDAQTTAVEVQVIYQRPSGETLMRTPVIFSELAIGPLPEPARP